MGKLVVHRGAHPLTRIAGAGLAGTLVVMGVAFGSPLLVFLDLPSMILVGGVTAAILLACHGVRGSAQAVGALFRGGNREQLALGTAYFMQAGALCIASGAMGTLIGLVQMLQQLDDPTRIGPAMAVALLTSFYGVVGAIASFSAAVTIASAVPETEAMASTAGVSSVVLSVGALVLLVPAVGAFGVLGFVFL